MEKHVRGVLLKNYIRMIKSRSEVDWTRYLEPKDLELLKELILPGKWYPLDSYQRMGAGIYREIAKGNPEAARAWGRNEMEELAAIYGDALLEKGDPRRAFQKFKAISRRFFDFDGFEIASSEADSAFIIISPDFGELEMEGYSMQMMGELERLVELCGDFEVEAEFVNRAWEGDGKTVLRIQWKKRSRAGQGQAPPSKKILVVDDDENACKLAELSLSRAGYEVKTRTQAFGSSQVVLSWKPDLVLLDVMMPALSGEHLLEIINKSVKPRPKVLFYSNKSRDELETLAREKNADGFVMKVEGPAALVKAVKETIGE